MSRLNSEGCRFTVGERVRILLSPATPFAGLEGTIDSVVPNSRGLTQLDGYVVKFNWGETQKFYDVQLQATGPRRAA
jgi:hypothetical protein